VQTSSADSVIPCHLTIESGFPVGEGHGETELLCVEIAGGADIGNAYRLSDGVSRRFANDKSGHNGLVMSGRAPADQGLFLALRGSWERSCLRPHMRAPPSIVFCRWRSEVSSLSRRASPANLTSGGITIPATVPHSGRESFEGTAPLFKTTLGATPKIGDVPSDHRTAMPSQCCPVPATVRWRAS